MTHTVPDPTAAPAEDVRDEHGADQARDRGDDRADDGPVDRDSEHHAHRRPRIAPE